MQQKAHHIHQLSIVSNTEHTAHALQLRKQLNKHWSTVLPELESAFDKLTPSNEWVRIPKLHLKISLSNSKDIESNLPRLLHDAIAEQLQPQLQTNRKKSTGQTLNLHTETTNNTALKNAIEDIDLLWNYLKTGLLPWYAKSETNWQPIFSQLIIDELSQFLITIIHNGDIYPCFRLLALLNKNDLKKIPKTVHSITSKISLQSQNHSASIITALIDDKLETSGHHQKLWILSSLLIIHPLEHSTAQLNLLTHNSAAHYLSKPQAKQWLEAETLSTKQQAYLQQYIFPHITKETNGNRVPERFTQKGKQRPSKQAITKPTDNYSFKDQEQITAQQIHFAGAILLHPYIIHYFQACKINTEDQQERAAALLFYAVTGEEAAAEYQLELIKLLIGLLPTSPLPLAAGLINDQDKIEAESMLESFISHWAALKNSTIFGLRQTFLQRPGLLKPQEHSWLLKIERRGVDVLLDKLPFGYSVIKLPWMKQPIHVEW